MYFSHVLILLCDVLAMSPIAGIGSGRQLRQAN
jgi:hypothetical protein